MDVEDRTNFLLRAFDDDIDEENAAEFLEKKQELIEERRNRYLGIVQSNLSTIEEEGGGWLDIPNILDIIDKTQGRAFGVVGAIKKFTTAAAIAAGIKVTNWDSLDPRTKIDAITKVLQQSNIQEILGESGRTISNLDREVIKDVFGSMTIFTSEAEIVKKLEDSRAKTLTASNQTRGEIAAGKDYFDITGRKSVVISKNKELIDLILKFDPDDFVSKGERKVVDVDYRKEFNR